MRHTVTLLLSLLALVTGFAQTAALGKTQPAHPLPPGPWASTWYNDGKYAVKSVVVSPWVSDADAIRTIDAYAAKQIAAGKPVVVTLTDPYQWVNKGHWTAAQFAARSEHIFAALAANGRRIDLLSLDAEPWDPRLVSGLITPYLRHYPGGLWCNYWTSVVPHAAVTAKPGGLAPLLRRFGAPNFPDDAQASVGETVNAPVCALWTGQAAAAQTRMGRIGQGVNRARAALIGDPKSPLVTWIASLNGCDAGCDRETCRDLDLQLMPLTGGRVLLFDESGPAKPTAGSDAVVDFGHAADTWLAALAGRHWAKALPGSTYCGIDDSYIVNVCELDTGERAFVVTARDKFTQPLPVAKDRDGYTCVVQPPTDGSRTAVAVFKPASR